MNKTPISILQELMVKKHYLIPTYTETISDKREFSFACTVQANEIRATGYGSNKKEAKQNSAYEALLQLNYPIRQPDIKPVYVLCASNDGIENKNITMENYVGKLNEFSSMNGKRYPMYDEDISPSNGRFSVRCNFLTLVTEGYGANKKTAKQESAKKMWELIEDKRDYGNGGDGLEGLVREKKDDINSKTEAILKKYEALSINDEAIVQSPTISSISPLKEDIDSLGQLQEILDEYNLKLKVNILQRNPYLTMLNVEGTHCVIMGHGNTESEAHDDLLMSVNVMFKNGYSFGKS